MTQRKLLKKTPHDREKVLQNLVLESHLLPLVDLIPLCRGEEHIGNVRSKVDLKKLRG